MDQADWNRAKVKAEGFTETVLMWLIGLPTPLTTVAVIVILLIAAYVGYSIK